MLEVSSVTFNSSKQKFSGLQKKNVSFKNAPQVAQTQAALPIQTTGVVSSGLKGIINLVPNSYIDEIGGAVLVAGLTALTRGKIKKSSIFFRRYCHSCNAL